MITIFLYIGQSICLQLCNLSSFQTQVPFQGSVIKAVPNFHVKASKVRHFSNFWVLLTSKCSMIQIMQSRAISMEQDALPSYPIPSLHQGHGMSWDTHGWQYNNGTALFQHQGWCPSQHPRVYPPTFESSSACPLFILITSPLDQTLAGTGLGRVSIFQITSV